MGFVESETLQAFSTCVVLSLLRSNWLFPPNAKGLRAAKATVRAPMTSHKIVLPSSRERKSAAARLSMITGSTELIGMTNSRPHDVKVGVSSALVIEKMEADNKATEKMADANKKSLVEAFAAAKVLVSGIDE
jgi:hypothetical protein